MNEKQYKKMKEIEQKAFEKLQKDVMRMLVKDKNKSHLDYETSMIILNAWKRTRELEFELEGMGVITNENIL